MPIVYALSNPAMPGLVKIGRTSRDDVADRMKELYTSGVPVPFECEFAAEVEDEGKAERALHDAFRPYQLNLSREFFEIEPDQATAILRILGKDVTPRISEEANKEVGLVDIEAGKKLKKSRSPNLNYVEMGIPIGGELIFTGESKEAATVCGPRRVMFRGEEMFLTRATKIAHDGSSSGRTVRHWTFQGRSLVDIYNETYMESDD